jgi:sporulation protein YlmC with PRC-barrel domain
MSKNLRTVCAASAVAAFVGLGASAGLAYTAAQTGAQPQQQWGQQAELQRGQFGQQYGFGATDRQYQQHGATGWQQHGQVGMTGQQYYGQPGTFQPGQQQFGQPGMQFGATQQQFHRQQQFQGQPGQQQFYGQPGQQQFGQPGQQFYGQQMQQQPWQQQQFQRQPGQQQFMQPGWGVTAQPGAMGQVGVEQGAQIGVLGVHPGQLQNAVSADRLLDANVRDITGRNIGNVRDVAVGPGGEVNAIIVSAGGFLGLGRNDYRIPWHQAIVSPTSQYVFLPVHEDQLEQYRSDERDRDRERQAQQRDQQQFAQQQPGQQQFAQQPRQQQQFGQQQQFAQQQQHMQTGMELKLSELMDDRVHLRDGQRYGRIDDVLISRDGRVAGVVIWPDRRAQGVPFVQPFDARVFSPDRDTHTLAYGPEHLGRVGPFNYLALGIVGPENRMRDAVARGPADQRGAGMTGPGAGAGTAQWGGQQQARTPAQDRDELARDQRAQERAMTREQRRQQDEGAFGPGATAPQTGAAAQAGATTR